ncbi:MAG: bifunctional phosphoribosyl-AMP cyclohydrolase/phosphoribosyl-ATP diphosphatase HisIE [Balneolales bacterium]
MISINDIAFSSRDGLVPAVIQDRSTKQVLMLGYMNREAVQKTLDSGKVTFYSRSKKRLWMKGEQSGNILNLVQIQKDCDNDALLVEADPVGPTCHTGKTSCFHEYPYNMPSPNSSPVPDAGNRTGSGTTDGLGFLNELQNLLYDRKDKRPEGSYTSKMFKAGRDKIAQKVGEEAVETVIASKNSREELAYEASDLLFHLMMLLTNENMKLQDLVKELQKRHK